MDGLRFSSGAQCKGDVLKAVLSQNAKVAGVHVKEPLGGHLEGASISVGLPSGSGINVPGRRNRNVFRFDTGLRHELENC